MNPCIHITKYKESFDWSEDWEHIFKTLKGALPGPYILAYPDDSHEFILDTDACLDTIGGRRW